MGVLDPSDPGSARVANAPAPAGDASGGGVRRMRSGHPKAPANTPDAGRHPKAPAKSSGIVGVQSETSIRRFLTKPGHTGCKRRPCRVSSVIVLLRAVEKASVPMSQYPCPLCVPGRSRSALSAACAVMLGLAALGGGCASNDSAPSRVAGPMPQPAVQSMRVDVEDDGLPSQLAPRHRRAVADDPAEPWSPNYGTVKSANLDPVAITAKLDGAAASTPRQPVRESHAMADADDIIRRAIAEHEIRQR